MAMHFKFCVQSDYILYIMSNGEKYRKDNKTAIMCTVIILEQHSDTGKVLSSTTIQDY